MPSLLLCYLTFAHQEPFFFQSQYLGDGRSQWVLTEWEWVNVRRSTVYLGASFDGGDKDKVREACGEGRATGRKRQVALARSMSSLVPVTWGFSSPLPPSFCSNLGGFGFAFYHRGHFRFKSGGLWLAVHVNHAFHMVSSKPSSSRGRKLETFWKWGRRWVLELGQQPSKNLWVPTFQSWRRCWAEFIWPNSVLGRRQSFIILTYFTEGVIGPKVKRLSGSPDS